MCAPAAPLAMGAAQAGIGAMGAFGAQGQEDAQWQAQVATTSDDALDKSRGIRYAE